MKYFKYLQENEKLTHVEYKSDLKKFRSYEIDEAYLFKYETKNFILGVTDNFPFELPIVILNDKVHLHPHIDQDGYICYDIIENINYDPTDIVDIIEKVLFSVKKIINYSKEEIEKELLLEYTDYLRNNKNYIDSNFWLIDDVSELKRTSVIELNRYKGKDYFISKDKSLKEKYPFNKYNKITKTTCFYIPLEKAPKIPDYFEEWDIKEIKNCISLNNLNLINSEKNKNTIEYYLFSFNYEGINKFFGLKLFGKKEKKDLFFINETAIDKIEVFRVKQINPEFLRNRGSSNVYKEKILLIGCGSLGSETLYHLAKSGFTDVTIADYDLLEPNNIYRHFLGFNSSFIFDDNNGIITAPKAEILKYEMQARYPDIKIKSIYDNIINAINKKRVNLNEYDYIIVTSGNVIVDKFINQILYTKAKETKAFFTWLEPYGVAYHTLMVDPKGKGCINCLYKSNRNIFLAKKKGNYINRNDTCIGSYTKFGSIVVSKQAIYVVEKLINIIQKREIFDNQHIVHKGDFNDFLSEGHELTEYSKLNQNDLDKMKKDFTYSGCDICG